MNELGMNWAVGSAEDVFLEGTRKVLVLGPPRHYNIKGKVCKH